MPQRQEKGNQHATKHGGAAATKAISKGEPFIGVAREVEKQIQTDFDAVGPLELMKYNGIRLQTAAELYWQAAMGAHESGEISKFESYIRVFGWLNTAASRTFRDYSNLKANEKTTKPIDVLASIKRGIDEKQ